MYFRPVLAAAHDPAPDRSAKVGDRSRCDHLHIAFENFFETACDPNAGKLLFECFESFGVLVIDHGKLSSGLGQAVDLPEEMPVIKESRGKPKIPRSDYLLGFRRPRRVIHSIGFFGHGYSTF